MALPEPASINLDGMSEIRGLAFSDECIRTCPQLQQKTLSAVMRFAIEGGELVDHVTNEIERAKEAGELPVHCELGPTTLSKGDNIHGARVAISGLSASTFRGIDPWDSPVLGVCRIDRDRAMNPGREPRAQYHKES